MGTEVVVRAEVPADIPGIRRAVQAAFVDQPVVPDLIDALRVSTAWRPGLSFVAEHDGQIVGHVLATRGWLDAAESLIEVLVLSPLGVVPDQQGRGIGARLVERLLAAAAEREEPAIFLEGSPDYYSRFGFVAAGAAGFGRPSLRIPEPAFQVKPLSTYRSGLAARLVYPDAFWAFDCVGLR